MSRFPVHDLLPSDLSGMTFAQYIRESTRQQADRFGPDSQRAENLSFATRWGLVDSHLEYMEFRSGTTTEGRHALSRAISDMREGHYRVLMFARTDRLARSMEDAPRIKREVAQAGGVIVYTQQGIVSGSRATELGENISHVLDQEYSRKLSYTIGSGLKAKFESGGTNGQPVLGTKHVYIRSDGTRAEGPERSTIARRAVDPDRVETLKALLGYYSTYGSYRRTAQWLNSNGHRTRSGQLFTESSIHDVVINPFYGPEEIVLYHERGERLERPSEQPVFPDAIHELWQRCQHQRRQCVNQRAREDWRTYPLHPVLRCIHCDSDFHGQVLKGVRHSHHMGRPCSGPYRVRSEALEAQMVELLDAFELPRSWRRQLQIVLKQPVDDTKSQRERLNRQLEQLRKQHLWDVIDDETFRRESEAIRAERDRLVPRETAVDTYHAPAELMRSVGTIVKAATGSRREDAMRLWREWIKTVFARIEVDGKEVKRVELRAGYRELFAIGMGPQLVYPKCARLDSNQHSR